MYKDVVSTTNIIKNSIRVGFVVEDEEGVEIVC